MPLLTPDDLKEHFQTSLSDTALQRIIDFNEAAINAVVGPLGQEVTEVHYLNGYESIILLRWRPQITTSPSMPVIIEGYGLSNPTTLADDDWRLSGSTLRRIDYGTHPAVYFDTPVAVTYVPQDNEDDRIRVLLALAKLDATYRPGLSAFTVGKHREEFKTEAQGGGYSAERDAILATLLPASPLFG